MGMPYLKSLRYSAAIVAALVLTACGGGGGASDTDITETDAYMGVTAAKSAEILLRDLVLDSTSQVEFLVLFTDVNIAPTGGAYSANISLPCETSGTVTGSYKKSILKQGLTKGDSFKTVFNDCVEYGYKKSGTIVLTALTDTTADVSNATTSIELPMSINITALSNEYIAGGIAETLSGTLKYTTLHYNFPNSSQAVLVGSSLNYKYENFILGAVETIKYSALSGTGTIDTATAVVTGMFNANVSGSYTFEGQTESGSMTLEANTSTPYGSGFYVPTAATYIITNFQGGKVVGTLPSGDTIITITVDIGNNGSIENTYTGQFADF